jgi:hypothetical protein
VSLVGLGIQLPADVDAELSNRTVQPVQTASRKPQGLSFLDGDPQQLPNLPRTPNPE